MTLATVPRYDRSGITGTGSRTSSDDRPRGRAVVVGAGTAGLLAARVLADAYAEVVLLEGDRLSAEPVARRGVPQGRHPHALLEAGRATIADLLPGAVEDLVSAGAVITDFASDVRFYGEGGFLAHGPRRMETLSATRPLLEQVLRRRVAALDPVDIRPGRRCTDYRLDGDTVDGVTVRGPAGEATVAADLVVDATGRASRTPAWLAANGYPAPPAEEVRIGMTYSTAFLERPPDDRRTFLVPPSPPRQRGGMAAPVEGDR
jgi:flavin-dependent dehydrogenase